ncbi:MAG TPA: BrnA antitoxin family protein [Pseudolabrys sp.]|nr:BrnA antitoxin family protein [Pseudolabrys sp.]
MNRPPGDRSRGSSGDARSAAEKAFKQLTTKPLDAPVAKPVVPHAKEQVTLRLDRDVIEHFQGGGPGWQDRLNDVLRRAIGK